VTLVVGMVSVGRRGQVLYQDALPAQEADFGSGGLLGDLMEEDVLAGEWTGRAHAHGAHTSQCCLMLNMSCMGAISLNKPWSAEHLGYKQDVAPLKVDTRTEY
jgi:hypothetical protein